MTLSLMWWYGQVLTCFVPSLQYGSSYVWGGGAQPIPCLKKRVAFMLPFSPRARGGCCPPPVRLLVFSLFFLPAAVVPLPFRMSAIYPSRSLIFLPSRSPIAIRHPIQLIFLIADIIRADIMNSGHSYMYCICIVYVSLYRRCTFEWRTFSCM